ncbi:energy transducer TonB [Desulfobotulus alkaliphilus]|nr:TonB family protein [Desulfobotulus alkaliphilus]
MMPGLENRFGLFLALSLAAHVFFLGSAMLFPRWFGIAVPQKISPMLVDLVAPVPSSGSATESGSVASVPEKSPAVSRPSSPPEPLPVKSPETLRLPAEEKPKEALTKKQAEAPIPLKRPSVPQRSRPSAEEVRRSLLDSALGDMARRVEEEGRPAALQEVFESTEKEIAEGPAGSGSGPSGVEGVRGAAAGRARDVYISMAAHRVQQNWAYAGSGGSAEGAVVVFHITREGRVRNLVLQQSSGNRRIDESARRAILKAEPFPSFPDALPDERIAIGFRFTDKGVDL